MDKITISRTGLSVNKSGFGALPIQRISKQDAVTLVRQAFSGGMDYFDTARAYSDSEEKLGEAFDGIRDKVVIATKTMGGRAADFWAQLEQSLKNLRTDYIDFHQFHNPAFCPKPGDESGLYDAMLEAKRQGKVRHIGITNHRLAVAIEAMESGLYKLIQYPINYLSTDAELEFVREAQRRGITVVAMKALSGGLITNAAAAYAYMRSLPNVIPIWGIQRESELLEFLECDKKAPELNETALDVINRDRAELSGGFCRACGYCMPCPAGIEIPTAARMSLLLRRAPSAGFLSTHVSAMMNRIEDCKHCGQCTSRCPYSLNTPELLRANLTDYREVMSTQNIG